MIPQRSLGCVVATHTVLMLVVFALARVSAQTVAVDANLDIRTRGPVHEAFAQPVVFDAAEGTVTTIEPPPIIEETPPDERPADDNAVWIPGYWSFDDASKAYLWITGCWRVPPPGHEWVPGYWNAEEGAWRWVAGFWRPITATAEVEYLPAPPPSIEEGAPAVAPSPEAAWIPGVWIWRDNAYVWRPGYWVIARPDWVFVPAHYVWTPSGWIYVDAAWDYAVHRRGILFAPVAFAVYPTIGFHFAPSVAININVFATDCFVRPFGHHYYFGDYYDQVEWQRGIYPAYAFHMSRYGYDPLFVSFSVHIDGHSDDHVFERRRERYEELRDHADRRPPHDYRADRDVARGDERDHPRARIGVPLAELPAAHESMKLRKSDDSDRARFAKDLRSARQDANERRRIETVASARTDAKPNERGGGRVFDPAAGRGDPKPGDRNGRANERPTAAPEGKPADRSTERTSEKPAERPAGRADQKPAEPGRRTDKPAERPTPASEGKPVDRSTAPRDDKPTERPVPRSDAKPGEARSGTRDDRPAQSPAERPPSANRAARRFP